MRKNCFVNVGKFGLSWSNGPKKLFLVLTIFTLLVLNARLGFSQSPELNWSKDGSRLWYRINERVKAPSFYLVDTKQRTKQKAFDSELVIQKLSKLTGQDSPRIRRIQFGDSNEDLFIISGKQKFKLNLETNDLVNAGPVAMPSSLFKRRKRSRNGAAIQLSINNSSTRDFQLFWIDYDGQKKEFGKLRQGAVRQVDTFQRHVWLVEIDGSNIGYFEVGNDPEIVIDDDDLNSVRPSDWTVRPNERSQQTPPLFLKKTTGKKSPDGKFTASMTGRQILELSDSGADGQVANKFSTSEGFEFNGSQQCFWSPNSKWLAVIESKSVETRKVFYIESSPSDGLQPKLRNYNYPKPGDPLSVTQVRLFDLEKGTEVKVETDLISNPYSIRVLGWTDDSDGFWLRYNQRGHQINRIVEIDPAQGTAKTVVEEKSDTFIHYSNPTKSLFKVLPNREFIWASERSGWNHLYRYSVSTGELINPVTSGDWNFCSLEKVDYQKKQIWFFAYGIKQHQDPYHKHFCRVNFDGSDLRVLTAGDGTHEIDFENEGQYFVDTYSRVDLAPIVELRDSDSGELVVELSRADTRDRFGPRRLTERFVAKGRDGNTDIWGIIHWPKDFDPRKKYPVVENIYAGPHDFHVPKKFRTRYYHQHPIADAGMIVVQIDGMGTAWRSKAFHDVCYKNLRDAGFPDRIAWMKSAAEKYPQMDLSRVGVYGGSAGGQNAMAALLWHHEFYKVAVADCGCHDNRMDKIWWNEQWMGWPVDRSYKDNSNMVNAHRLKGKLMLTLGELDRNVDPASTTQVVRKLIQANKDFDFVLVAGAGHGAGETPWAARKRIKFLSEHLHAEQSVSLNVPAVQENE